jgi:DNA repair exonuclease SbcCD ATPase subunit
MARGMTKGELEDELKQRDRRIEELRQEIDELRDLNQRLGEHADDYANIIEQWKEAFDMVLDDDGKWSWGPFLADLMVYKIEAEDQRKEYNALVQKHNDLVQKWNMKMLGGNPIGRPLAASQTQIVQVLELRNAGT